MKRFLVIDQDRTVTQRLGLACLERGVGVVMAENVCDGVRTLLSEDVSLIVVDAALIRLTAREQARLFERVAPGVPVVVVVRPDASLDARVGFELAGFTVRTRPVSPEDLIEKDG
jgi:DNA-binding response OmpR family regulator